MKWITRARPKTDRIACPWLITKFIDPGAEILYVPADQVLDEAQRQGAANIADDLDTDPAGPGLLAIGIGGLDVEDNDHRLLERGTFVYDALYAWCQRQVPTPHERHHRVRGAASTAPCPTPTSTPSTCPQPAPSPSAYPAPPATAAPET